METPVNLKLHSKEDLLRIRNAWRLTGNKVVFTNGCFDVLHMGHVQYLFEAKKKGDKLIVGLNSDASVTRLKGAERPYNGAEARAWVLCSLMQIDGVCFFEEDTPLDLINFLKPDCLVKGADYNIDNIVGAKEVLSWGGSVETIELTEGYSSSSIIEKLK